MCCLDVLLSIAACIVGPIFAIIGCFPTAGSAFTSWKYATWEGFFTEYRVYWFLLGYCHSDGIKGVPGDHDMKCHSANSDDFNDGTWATAFKESVAVASIVFLCAVLQVVQMILTVIGACSYTRARRTASLVLASVTSAQLIAAVVLFAHIDIDGVVDHDLKPEGTGSGVHDLYLKTPDFEFGPGFNCAIVWLVLMFLSAILSRYVLAYSHGDDDEAHNVPMVDNVDSSAFLPAVNAGPSQGALNPCGGPAANSWEDAQAAGARVLARESGSPCVGVTVD